MLITSPVLMSLHLAVGLNLARVAAEAAIVLLGSFRYFGAAREGPRPEAFCPSEWMRGWARW